jgi:outer membrane receptor protein involved in Fe transport
MRNFLVVCISAFFILSAQLSFSQQFQRGNSQGNNPTDTKVTGTIIDSITGQPVEYAIVAIRKIKDSSLVTGSTSVMNGNFNVEGLPYGKFYAEVTFIGYKKQVIRGILLTPNQKTVNIGKIKIEPSSTEINAVVVSGDKPAIIYKLDRKVIDVTQNVVAAGGTVVDALQNIPSIQSDIEGNVTLRGSSNFIVLVDGKPSPFSGSEALQQIPANLVQNVEIITNPSAKFDAEGSAGIINVVMKKQNVSGMNGLINLTAGTGEKYSGNLNINYKISKFNFSLGLDFNDNKNLVTNYMSNIDTLVDKHMIQYQAINGNGNFHRRGKGLKAGIDYNINDNNTLSFSGNINSRNFNRSFNSTYTDKYVNDTTLQSNEVYYRNYNGGLVDMKHYNMNLDYQLKLNDKGHNLSTSVNYSVGPEDNNSPLFQDTTNANWETLGRKQINQQTIQNTSETDLRTKIDYVNPFSEKGKLEAGYQGRYEDNKGDHIVNNYVVNEWIEDINLRDKIEFKTQIHAAYVTFSNSFVLFDYQVGLRAEYEKRSFDQRIQNKLYKLERTDYFPTIHISRQLPWDLQIQASYSKRIDRPRDWNLNPTVIHIDPQTIRLGNPYLKPQFTHSYELNIEKKINEASFFSIEGFYRKAVNLIQQTVYKDTIRTLTFSNIDHDRSIGLEFMLNLAPAKWFNFNSSWSIFNYTMFGKLNSTPNSNNQWNLRINPTVRLPWGTSVQINYIYNAPTITAQGTRSAFYNSGVGIRQEILKHKGSLTLQIQNPFGRSRITSTTSTSNLYSFGWFQRETKVYMLTFSYRINNYKVQKTKNQQEENGNAPEMDMMGNQ